MAVGTITVLVLKGILLQSNRKNSAEILKFLKSVYLGWLHAFQRPCSIECRGFPSDRARVWRLHQKTPKQLPIKRQRGCHPSIYQFRSTAPLRSKRAVTGPQEQTRVEFTRHEMLLLRQRTTNRYLVAGYVSIDILHF